MGTDILAYMNAGCDHLLTSVAPSVDVIGIRLLLALATIMMVWFGVQEALASAQGGPGFNMAKFLNFVLLLASPTPLSPTMTARFRVSGTHSQGSSARVRRVSRIRSAPTRQIPCLPLYTTPSRKTVLA